MIPQIPSAKRCLSVERTLTVLVRVAPFMIAVMAIMISAQSAFAQSDDTEGQERSSSSSMIESTMTIDLLDQVAVSSSVDGVIQTINARTGDTIQKNALLVQLDTSRLNRSINVAKAEFDALAIRSANDSRVQIGRAREHAAQVNVQKLREVKTRYNVNLPQLELTRAESELRQATSEKVGARKELAQFNFEAQAKQSEISLLKFDLDKSTILSRYDGAIARIEKRPGEFVTKGETIAELYRLDRLSGVVLIGRDQLLPEDAEGVQGEFVIDGGDGQNQAFNITIRRVFPRVDVDGKYRAFVELENRQTDDGKWRLLPGIVGQATFEMKANTTPELNDAAPEIEVLSEIQPELLNE